MATEVRLRDGSLAVTWSLLPSDREGLSAVRVEGGIAGNVIPDMCTVTVNFRFAPDRSVEQAYEHVREVFTGYEPVLTDIFIRDVLQLDGRTH